MARMHAASLSVNINKIALLRNSRGGNQPDVLLAARRVVGFGAQGITVHPRPDGRHIRRADVVALKPLCDELGVEFNVEGYPSEDFLRMLEALRPAQATLVPDPPGALTSDAGWDTVRHLAFLREVCQRLHEAGIRTSIFLDTEPEHLHAAQETGTRRVELYTGPYAARFLEDPPAAVAPYAAAGAQARLLGLGLNAGHDLNQANLRHFVQHVPNVLEVSIGHAIVCEALYEGLAGTIAAYRACLA